jgi:hypothetical protein
MSNAVDFVEEQGVEVHGGSDEVAVVCGAAEYAIMADTRQ